MLPVFRPNFAGRQVNMEDEKGYQLDDRQASHQVKSLRAMRKQIAVVGACTVIASLLMGTSAAFR